MGRNAIEPWHLRLPSTASHCMTRSDAVSEKNDKHANNYQELNGPEGLKKIADLAKGIHIAMMTTVAGDGSMSSRPMAVQDEPFDGTLWFLTRSTSGKVEEIANDQHVTLTF